MNNIIQRLRFVSAKKKTETRNCINKRGATKSKDYLAKTRKSGRKASKIQAITIID